MCQKRRITPPVPPGDTIIMKLALYVLASLLACSCGQLPTSTTTLSATQPQPRWTPGEGPSPYFDASQVIYCVRLQFQPGCDLSVNYSQTTYPNGSVFVSCGFDHCGSTNEFDCGGSPDSLSPAAWSCPLANGTVNYTNVDCQPPSSLAPPDPAASPIPPPVANPLTGSITFAPSECTTTNY